VEGVGCWISLADAARDCSTEGDDDGNKLFSLRSSSALFIKVSWMLFKERSRSSMTSLDSMGVEEGDIVGVG